jgi:hypothetical protein
MDLLGIDTVFCGAISLGDGTVKAAHGLLPVPAPATLKLLEGHAVRPGPEGAGELVTPTGAALVRVLSSGPPPLEYVPIRSGFGAGTKDFRGRANALRLIVAEDIVATESAAAVEQLVMLATDIDDMAGEYLSALTDALREHGALDVVLLATTMKKGRPGVRLEVLCAPADAGRLEDLVLSDSTTIGVRRSVVARRALTRRAATVEVLGQSVRVKIVTLPDGTLRAKPEFDDVIAASRAAGKPVREVLDLAARAALRV